MKRTKLFFGGCGIRTSVTPAERESIMIQSLKIKKRYLLITGSNMSGKSTPLRTAGINLVLALVPELQFVPEAFKLPLCLFTLVCGLVITGREYFLSFYAELLGIKQTV